MYRVIEEEHAIKIMVDDHIMPVKRYMTHQQILDDFLGFQTIENVRTCKRMQTNKKSQFIINSYRSSGFVAK
jgi:hypothetical protein